MLVPSMVCIGLVCELAGTSTFGGLTCYSIWYTGEFHSGVNGDGLCTIMIQMKDKVEDYTWLGTRREQTNSSQLEVTGSNSCPDGCCFTVPSLFLTMCNLPHW